MPEPLACNDAVFWFRREDTPSADDALTAVFDYDEGAVYDWHEGYAVSLAWMRSAVEGDEVFDEWGPGSWTTTVRWHPGCVECWKLAAR